MRRLQARAAVVMLAVPLLGCSDGGTNVPDPPATVNDLEATVVTSNSVTLEWTQVDNGQSAPADYAVAFGSPVLTEGWALSTGTLIGGTLVGAAASHTFTGLSPQTDYQFQLVAYRGSSLEDAVPGPGSNLISLTTPAVTEPLVAGLASATGGDGNVFLSAEAPTGGTPPYTFQWHRGDAEGFTPDAGNELAGFDSLEETDTDVANGASYFYRLVAADDAGASVVYEEASATPSSFGEVHGNEPADFTFILENPFDELLPAGWQAFDGFGNYTLTDDVTAPQSPQSVGTARYAAGFVGGSGPFTLLAPAFSSADLYVEFWFKVSENWQGHVSGVNKIFFFDDNSQGHLYFSAQGSAQNPLQFQVRSQGTPMEAVNYTFDSDDNQVDPPFSAVQIVRGEWRHIEVILRMNTPGAFDGEIHVWIDGVKTHQFTDQAFVLDDSDGKLEVIKWNGTFGGGNADTVQETQFQFIDHLYISGSG